MKNITIIIILSVIAIIVLCCCLCLVAIGVFSLAQIDDYSAWQDNPLPIDIPVLPPITQPTQTYNPDFIQKPGDDQLTLAYETLSTLQNTFVPENDPRELAARLKNVKFIPETVPNETDFQVGDKKDFWVTNVDTNENRQITAILQYATENSFFWFEEGVKFNAKDLEILATSFEKDIIPTNREFFGTEDIPGIDEDHRLYVLFATDLGSSLAGYFSSADSLPPEVHQYSNAHEMFLLNADNVYLDEEFTFGVLAHEYQHMIHFFRDRNETSWLNEGFSELAAFLNNYYDSGFDFYYLQNTDVQLNDWPNDSDATIAHYGSSFLFVNYFLNRFGEEATKLLVKHENNGLDSLDDVLKSIDARDPSTNQPVSSDDLFVDWIITNYLNDENVGDGHYVYKNYSRMTRATITETIDSCNFPYLQRTVSQYGIDYIELSCDQEFKLTFKGSAITNVIPESSYSGNYAFWSNKGDESHMVLSQKFDFSNISSPISMTFMTWYDIEVDYDYLYLTASVDGENWDIVQTTTCTTENPSGNSYGCGFNGVSNSWVKQYVDLSPYAGNQVELRFEYITDAAVNGEGLLIDDIEIPAIAYQTDFEENDGGWKAEGWARISNYLPQTYELVLIEFKGGEVKITRLDGMENQEINIPINGKLNNKTILLVSGTTRYTRQKALYEISAD